MLRGSRWRNSPFDDLLLFLSTPEKDRPLGLQVPAKNDDVPQETQKIMIILIVMKACFGWAFVEVGKH